MDNRSKWHQAASAVLAGSITASLFVLLGIGPPINKHALSVPTSIIITIQPKAVPSQVPQRIVKRKEAAPVPELLQRPKRSNIPSEARLAKQSALEPRAAFEMAGPNVIQPSSAALSTEAPASSASAPLKLDAATIRSAGARSIGAVRRLAESSGQKLPSSTISSLEQFGSGVARAGKTDCLAPNPNGSLLSIPIIAYGALTGRCK